MTGREWVLWRWIVVRQFFRYRVLFWTERARARRWHHARAREVFASGGLGYCVWHACDVRHCPPGEHE